MRDGIPGWALRVGVGVAAAAATTVAMTGAADVGVLSTAGIVMMGLTLGTALVPGTVIPLLLLIGLVVYRLLAAGPVLDLRLVLLVLLMPLISQLAGLAGAIPSRSRCAWTVFRRPALRFAAAVLPVQIALLVVAITSPTPW